MFTTRPEILGTFGVVGSTHWLASQSAMAMLEAGGNAFDAVVAGGLVLQVVEPHMNGLGGDLPIIFHDAGRRATKVLCGQGPAPAGATLKHYRDLGLDLMPGSGLLATVIPGAFDAWMTLLRDHGSLPPAKVFEAAIGYAENGWPMMPLVARTIEQVIDLFNNEWPTSAATWLPGGKVPVAGELFRNPGLAKTYKRLLAEGEARGGDRVKQIEGIRNAWRQGFVAEAIDRFSRGNEVMDTSGRRHRGVLTGQDMAGHEAHYEEPVGVDYGDWTVLKAGFWGQGPVFLQQLKILDGLDLAQYDPDGPEFIHLVTEAAKLAMADREAYYGDPNFVRVPAEVLLSSEYAAQRRAEIGERASAELKPGRIDGYDPRIDFTLAERPEGEADISMGGGEPVAQDSLERQLHMVVGGRGAGRGDTCHIDVIDRWGNMVSATPSGAWLQSSPTIPELGFCLNSRAQMFWLEDGVPATLAPGKRPRTTLSVNLALKDGKPAMVFGTPGGDYQDQWTVTFFLRYVHHDGNIQQSIDRPMFHTDHMPSSFWPRAADLGSLTLEARVAPETLRDLQRRGHRVNLVDGWSQGRISAARKSNGTLKAGANARLMQGYAVGR
jgi:gamma-glutamyltranspeptidase / glutathione hydrolase